jgi:hypothetical protein
MDPWEVLGVGRDASMAEAKAAYRRLVALFHPDHLQGMSEAVRAEGERRLREATAALEAMRILRGRRWPPMRPPGRRAGGGTAGAHVRPPASGRPAGEAGTAGPEGSGRPGPEGSGRPGPDRPLRPPTPAPDGRTYNAQVRALDEGGLHATWPGRHAGGMWTALRQGHTVEGPIRQVEWGAYEGVLSGAEVHRLLCEALPDGGADWRRQPLETLSLGAGRLPAGEMDLGTLAGLVDDRRRYVVTAEVFTDFD